MMTCGRPLLWRRQQGGPGAVWRRPTRSFYNSFCRRLLSSLLRGENKHNSTIVEAYDDLKNLPVLVPYSCVGSLLSCAGLQLGVCGMLLLPEVAAQQRGMHGKAA